MANLETTLYPVRSGPMALLRRALQKGVAFMQVWLSEQYRVTRRVMVGTMLVLALLAFELFNYDTTEYALERLLGAISFAGIPWATILAIAFCAIDFAGLARLVAPEHDRRTAGADRMLKRTWLLLGAWLLGGAVNAAMTWWAVSLALAGRDLGNEVLTREQLLHAVPVLVAVLVWVTRILLISSFVSTADPRLDRDGRRLQSRPLPSAGRSANGAPALSGMTAGPRPVDASEAMAAAAASEPAPVARGRVRPAGARRRRPSVPRAAAGRRTSLIPLVIRRSEAAGRRRAI